MINAINVKLDNGAFMPYRAHDLDAGYDIRTPIDFAIKPMSELSGAGKAVIDTGVHIEIPEGYVGILKSKSGLSLKYDIQVGAGTIDCGFNGSIRVILYNHGKHLVKFKAGDKITQLVIVPIATPRLNLVEELSDSERGDGGFGSTGR